MEAHSPSLPINRQSRRGDGTAAAAPPSDSSLLQRYRMGEEFAATELYRRYAARLRSLARRLCSSLGRYLDADDIVQAVFCALFAGARRGAYDLPEGADLWRLILVIALNKVRGQRTFHRAAKRDMRRTTSGEYLRAQKQPASAPEHELSVVLDDALAQVDEPGRHMIQLRLEGYEVAEIADKLSQSKRTVERRLQAIRERLARILGAEPCYA